ncbi:ATP-binding protein [Amycolatopsis sp. cmx-11-12]|uniref:ATP-binding protein n=1 Tax=Amycolatopsis sp. cmx-11-12 TaxID=2785795 RepID=UPI0039180C38
MTSYVGRRADAAEVRSVLGSASLVTLTGTGGVGKTRLAADVATTAVSGFADGAIFVELAELRDAGLLPNLVADRLGLRVQDQEGGAITRGVLDYLRDRAMLVVLDNCEHLLEACAEFAAATLAHCPRVKVLATGRQSLRIAGEQVMRVTPLRLPDEGARYSLEKLLDFDGIRLFVDRASAVVPSFRLTEENSADVIRVCRGLDGLPLAIELAAARIRLLSPRQLADKLGSRLALLTAAPRTAPDRQRTLRATIDWSYHSCSAAERSVWARAAVFAGSFDLDGAEVVCVGPGVERDRVLDLIDGLLDKSVLTREEHGGVVRFRMLESLREYGLERLDEAGGRSHAARRHRDWIDQLTERADQDWVGPNQLSWVGQLRHEQANLRVALGWSLTEPDEADAALRIACRLDEYWTLRGFNAEARGWLDRALAATSPDHPQRPRALAGTALYALWHSDVELAAIRLREAEELAVGRDDKALDAFLTYVRSLESMIRIGVHTADLAAEAAAAFRAIGIVRRELHPLYIQGVATAYLGDLDTAREVLRRMVLLSDSCGELYYRSIGLAGIVHVEVQFGDADAAAAAAREGLVAARALGSRFQLAYRLDGLAWVASRQGEHDRAAILFGAAATVWEAVGASPEVAVALPHDRFLRATRDALGDRFGAHFDTGRAFTGEKAIRFALGEETAGTTAPARRSDELTKREWEIADLVTEGLSNRDIADRLVISRRTADTHVQHILTKLGFRNRAQIAVWVTGKR